MRSRPSNPALWLAAVLAAGAAVLPAGAQPQPAPAQPEQPAFLSKPEGTEDPVNTANASLGRGTAGGGFNIGRPVPLFDVLPGSSGIGAISPGQAQQWQKFNQDRKNWPFMTPGEILGVPTPEKILGIPDPNDDPSLTPEERFLRRSESAARMSATNALSRQDASRLRGGLNPFHQEEADGKAGSGPGKNLNQLLNEMPVQPFGQEQPADSPWSSVFNLPAAPAKPDPDQVASMEHFRALLAPTSPPDKSPVSAGPVPVAGPDPNLQPLPQFNPLGNSFMPLQSGISRPTGITPLPGVTKPSILTTTKAAPLVKAPPWLSDGPQPPGMPQRQF